MDPVSGPGDHSVAAGRGGVVAAGHPTVARAALDLLAAGGNAVDAAVGAFFTAFHAEPLLASAGGGGFLVADVDGEATAWDFFSAAPGLGTGPEPYRPEPGAFWAEEVDFGSARQIFHVGPGSVAVPGALAGLCTAQREAGRLPLATALEPALRACEQGTATLGMGAFAVTLLEPIIRSDDHFRRFFDGPGDDLIREGDRFHNPDLGAFYRALARAGSERLLYDGDLTRPLVRSVREAGGGLTLRDLRSYEVRRCRPVEVAFDGATLLLAPPVSSGGMLLAYGAALLAGLPSTDPGTRDDVLLLRAVMAQTLHARAAIIGTDTPTRDHAAALLDGACVQAGRDRVQRLLEHGIDDLPDEPSEPLGSTTHVSVIDREGNACAVTVSNGENSGLVVPGQGVFLNNFLGEADLNPGGFHRFAPGQRLGSSMAPMLVRHPDGTVSAVGSGGSNRIRTALLQVVRHLVAHDLDPAHAVGADRLHYEDGVLYAEATNHLRDLGPTLRDEGLRTGLFHQRNMFFGGAHLAQRRPDGTVVGVGDDRRSGAAAVEEPPG